MKRKAQRGDGGRVKRKDEVAERDENYSISSEDYYIVLSIFRGTT